MIQILWIFICTSMIKHNLEICIVTDHAILKYDVFVVFYFLLMEFLCGFQ